MTTRNATAIGKAMAKAVAKEPGATMEYSVAPQSEGELKAIVRGAAQYLQVQCGFRKESTEASRGSLGSRDVWFADGAEGVVITVMQASPQYARTLIRIHCNAS